MESLLGEIYALSTAVCWALCVICFTKASEQSDTAQIKLFHNTITVIGLFFVTIAVGSPLLPNYDAWDWFIVISSAFVGITLGDTFFLYALQKLGSSLMAVMEGMYPIFVLVLFYFIYGEKILPIQMLGISMVIIAILIPSIRNSDFSISRDKLVKGVGVAVATMLMMAITVVLFKQILDDHDIVSLTLYRFAIGQGLLVAYMWWRQKRNFTFSLSGVPNLKLHILGVILGPITATLFWVAGFKYAKAGVAATLNLTSTLFIFLFAWLILKEPISRFKVLSIILTFSGVLLITISKL